MSVHLQRQLERLKRMLLGLGAQVEENLIRVIACLEGSDAALAAEVIAADRPIDQLEIAIEEECLHTLALHQPVAFDVRYVVGVLKMKTELERIGDLAVNIAERSLDRDPGPAPQEASKARQVADHAVELVRLSLDAIVDVDTQLARDVVVSVEAFDRDTRELDARLIEATRQHPDRVEAHLPGMSNAHYLRRVGTHAGQIARHVISMAEGHDAIPMHAGSPEPESSDAEGIETISPRVTALG
ncbi:MAG: phosphate signaling complex protein PhoU [Planctomycetota bacterium]